jgi:hypothetical protein
MSLDLSLRLPDGKTVPNVSTGIFVRQNGATSIVSRDEWERLNPGQEPYTVTQDEETEYVFERNITHNLGEMARHAYLYESLWCSDGKTAGELINEVTERLFILKQQARHFKQFNPANGWGCYEDLVSFTEAFLVACQVYPEAIVEVSK